MPDATKPIETAWDRFAKVAVLPGTPYSQVESMKSVFFAGSLAASALINETNASGGNVDLLFDHIEAEMDVWEETLRQKAVLSQSAPAGRA